MSFVVANYELLNGLSRGLKIVCNLTILLKKQLRKKQKYEVLLHNYNQFNLLSEISKTVGSF